MAGVEVAPGVFTELTRQQQERGMRLVVYTTVVGVLFFFSIYGSALTLFARKLGASEEIIGLLATLIQMSVLLQLPLAREVEARGKKRLLIPSWAAAATFALPLILIPLLPEVHWLRLTVLVTSVALTAVVRQPGLVAWMPLLSDVIPDDIRGRFFGRMRTAWQTSALILTIGIAALFGREAEWWQFQVVFAIGVLSALVRIPLMKRIPELAPHPEARERGRFSFIGEALRDRSFACFTALVSLVYFAGAAMGPHAVVYMRETLKYRDDFVVFVTQALPLIGAILTLILWGNLADRIGARAILVFTCVGSGLAGLVWLFVVPENPTMQGVLAGSLFLRGLLMAGFGIGAARYLYGVLPEGNKSGYLAAHTAATGLGLGLGPLLTGFVLGHTSGFRLEVLGGELDSYKVLFGLTAVGMMLPLVLMGWVRTPGEAPTREFLSFLLYRPFRTTLDLVRYHRPLGEERRAEVTRRLATTSTAVTLRELLEGLEDPSYEVRQAAAQGLAQRRQPGVVPALLAKLDQEDSLIRPAVIWALGELRAAEAVGRLINLLEAPDRHVRAQAALALGKIGRPEAIGPLRKRLAREEDRFVWACLATALSRLGSTCFVPLAVRRLAPEEPEVVRRQLATAVGTTLPIGEDFYHILRSEIGGRGSAVRRLVRRALQPLRNGRNRALPTEHLTLHNTLRAAWQAYVRRDDRDLLRLAAAVPALTPGTTAREVIRETLGGLADSAAGREAVSHEEALLALVAVCAACLEAKRPPFP